MAQLPKLYRALQLNQPGSSSEFRIVQRALELPSANQVLVKVAGCAIAYRDVLDRKGAFKFIRRPTVLGHEFSGCVVAAGRDVRSCREGDQVVSLHWDQEGAWPSPLKSAGAVDTMFGLTCDGGYAEFVLARPGSLARAPTSVPLVDASCLVSTYGTVWHASVTKGNLRQGQTVLVTGASGGVGSAGVGIAKSLGCRVVGVTSSSEKAEHLKTALGCDEVIVAADGKFKVKEPVDHVIEAVGGPTFTSSLRCVAPGGTMVLLGNVANSVSELPLGLCILNSIRIIGSDSIPKREFEEDFTEFFVKHALKPSVQEYVALQDIPKVHDALEAKKVVGRIIADMSKP